MIGRRIPCPHIILVAVQGTAAATDNFPNLLCSLLQVEGEFETPQHVGHRRPVDPLLRQALLRGLRVHPEAVRRDHPLEVRIHDAA
ncbi:uncharacterized protein M6B38_272065 [Iris pallida]|uniref:Secreted protein n=1 Tax=Iris pallida TaxID=29817 RepID=A0AAX6GUX5_IRIPA|nr:uncharacterized protein M6B38_345630 [Iris pallida]KAJ6848920.1 uncharacterized protein M6B38_272060 [Iris pallida]KAJ6848921.1 uncharacterized protein M6B38_272065 [Iris pallida]